METKICSKCNQEKSIDCFGLQTKLAPEGGYRHLTQCKDCNKAKQAEYRKRKKTGEVIPRKRRESPEEPARYRTLTYIGDTVPCGTFIHRGYGWREEDA